MTQRAQRVPLRPAANLATLCTDEPPLLLSNPRNPLQSATSDQRSASAADSGFRSCLLRVAWLPGLLAAAALLVAGCGDVPTLPDPASSDAGSPVLSAESAPSTQDSGSRVSAPESVGSGETGGGTEEPPAGQPLIDAMAGLSIGRYLGRDLPVVRGEALGRGEVYNWTFDPEDGPMCLRGAPWRFVTRVGERDDLLIFLQGGGACWSAFCLAVTAAPNRLPRIDILNDQNEENPVAGWNVAYLPYCDGSLFLGDRDHDDSGDGEPDRFHRGLQNLSSALDVAKQEFPEPPRILLAGSSGGAFGTIVAVGLVRTLWPHASIRVINDAGVGVVNGEDPAFLDTILDEFGLLSELPEDCDPCVEEGHVLRMVEWTLERDPSLRIGVFSSWRDAIIADTFLKVGGDQFARELEQETTRVHERFPEQYRRFIVDGRMHTTLLGDATGIIGNNLNAVELPDDFLSDLGSIQIGRMATTAIGERRFVEWFAGLVEGDDARWVDVLDEDRGGEGASSE